MKYALCLVFTIGTFALAKADGPNLIYSNSDVPALREKVKTEKYRELWKDYLAQADKYCDPASKDYANPDRVALDLDQFEYDIRGHMSGKRLTNQMQYLGLAYHLTGDAKYKDTAIKVLLAYAQTIPVTHDYHIKGYAGGKGDAMRGLAMGYDQFGEFLTPEQKQIVLNASRGYIEDFLKAAEDPATAWVPYHNYLGVDSGAAGLLALQLAEIDPAASKDYLARCVNRLKLWLDSGFDKQGAYYEGVAYSTYGLGDSTMFMDALKRSGGEDLFQHPTMKHVMDFYVQSTLPGEKVADARNDGNYWTLGELMLKYAAEQKDGRGTWLFDPAEDADPLFPRLIWDKDVPAVTPEEFGTPLAAYFEGRGLCVWRTGWQNKDVMFSVECGPHYSVTHSQADKGQITLYGYGYRWLCDSGYPANRDPEGRGQTIAHNLIMVDGKGQGLSGGGLGTNGKILNFENNEVFGYALADETEAYRQNVEGLGTGDQLKPIPNIKMDHALRHNIFMRPSHGAPAYAVVLDNIRQDSAAHDYTWQILSWDNLEIKVTGTGSALVTPKPEAAKEHGPGQMFVFIDAAAAPTLTTSFYAPDAKPPTPRLQAVSKAANPYFASVLIPTDGSVAAPTVNFDHTPETTTIHIEWPGRTDTIVWKKNSKDQPEITVSPIKNTASR